MPLAILTLAMGLLVPPMTPPAVHLPTTTTLAVGVLEGTRTLKGDLYQGGTETLDLSSMLDSVPVDKDGAGGAERDEAGVSRISERSEKKLTPAEEQAAKKAAFAAKQAKAAEQGLFPDVALPKLPF